MMKEEDEEAGDGKAVMAAIRSAKKNGRPKKIGIPEIKSSIKNKSKSASKKKPRVTSKAGGAFDRELGQKAGGPGHAREGVRAKKNDKVSLTPKKGGKRKGK